MAPKRLLEQPPPANSSSEDESVEEEEEEEAETQIQSQNQNKNGVVEAADEEERSEDDDEDDEEDEEDDDDNEEEEEKVKSQKPTVAKPSESSGSGSETESDDNTPPSPSLSGFTIKPIASKPMDDNDDEDETTTPSTSVKPNKKKAPADRPNKRAAEAQESEPDEKDSKSNNKKRKVNSNGGGAGAGAGGGGGGDEEDAKKVTRFWTEEDEIAVLKGMTEYKTKKGADPYADMGAFHEFIKKSLNADVKKNQLVDKIRRLKKKYLNNVAKGENNEDPVISKPHELKSFQLSKKIWGNGDSKNPSNGSLAEDNNSKSNSKKKAVPSTPKSTATVLALPRKDETGKKEKKTEKAQANGKAKIVKEKEEDEKDEEDEEMEDVVEDKGFWEKYPSLKNSLRSSELEHLVSSIKKVMPLIENSKVKKLEKKWKDLEADEMEIFTRRAQLLGEQVKMVSDFVKSK